MRRPDFTPVCAAVLKDWKAARRRALRSGATRGAVHALRIRVRRLLALEKLLAPRGGRPRATTLAHELHDLFHASGRLRDAQLLARAMRSLGRGIPQAARLARHEQHREPRLARQLRRRLRDRPMSRLAPIVASWLQPRHGDPRVVLAERAARRLREAQQRLATGVRAGGTAPHSLHRRRILLKELRYMAELAGEAGCALPRSLSVQQLTVLQQKLGAVTDIDMQLHKVARFGARHPGWRPSALQLRRELRRQRAAALESL